MSSPQAPGESGTEGEDLYTTLHVPRDASVADLRASFRRLSQRYHPDKHVDENAKATATNYFTKVKEAYEILSNEKFRRVYNEFGLEAARAAAMPGMELVPYSDLAERFRNDAMGGAGSSGANNSRDAYFTVSNSLEPRLDATGLMGALEDGDVMLAGNLAIFTQVGLSTMATAYVSQRNTLAFRYALAGQGSRFRAREGTGVGDVAVSVRHQLDQYMHAEGTAYIPLDEGRSTTYGFKAFRALSQDMTGAFEATFDPERQDLTTALTYSRSFDERRTASVSWAYGAAPAYAFTWRRSAFDEYVSERDEKSKEDDIFGTEAEGEPDQENPGRLARLVECIEHFVRPMGWRWTARWGIMDASLGFVLRRPIGQNAPLWKRCEAVGPGGASVKIRGQFGVMGWEVEVGGGRKYVIADTAWGTSVAFGTLGVVWRFKMSRGGHRFSLPVVLHSTAADPKTATIAALSTSLLVSAVQVFLIGPWQARKEQEGREEAKARRADVLEHSKAEAEAAQNLLRQSVERSRKREEEVEIDGKQRCGLLIKRAVYGIETAVRKMTVSEESLNGKEIELEMTDVTDCVQVLVESSAVQVVSATKSTLPGFWDPSAFGDKEEMALRIWYLFRGEAHECVLRDNQAIELPLSSHRVSDWS